MAVIVAAVLGMLCWMAFGAGAARAGGPCVGCSGTWNGEWSATYQRLEPTEAKATVKIHLKWTATLVSGSAGNVWTLGLAEGSFSISGSTSPNEDCATTLSPGPDAVVNGEAFWVATATGKGLHSEDEHEYETVITRPPFSWGQTLQPNPLESSNAAGGCGAETASRWGMEGPWLSSLGGPGCHFEVSAGVNWIAFPNGGTHSENDTCTAPDASDGRGDSWSGVSYSAQVTLTAPGTGPPGGAVGAKGQPGPNYKKIKEDAKVDFKQHAAPDAAQYCLPYAGGLLTFGAGVLLLGSGSIGGTLAITGSLTASALSPFCNATLTRLGRDVRTFRDPPLASVGVLAAPHRARVAALPSCARYHGRQRRYCKALSGAYTRLDRTAAQVAADSTAMEETISRETAALNSGNLSAASAQDVHLGALLATENADRGAEGAAGRSVAAALRSGGVLFKLSKKQSIRAIAAMLKQAAKHGVSRSDIAALAPAVLTPKPVDLRAGLGRL